MSDTTENEIVAWCTHPRVTHRHGTRAAYTSDHCKCDPCTEADRTYQSRRARSGLHDQISTVDAGPVIRHLAELRQAHMGRPQIAAAAQISNSTLTSLLVGRVSRDPGRPGRVAAERVNSDVAARIMRVRPVTTDDARVPAEVPRLQIQALVWAGWSLAEIGRRLNMDASDMVRLLRTKTVAESVRRSVDQLHEELRDLDPPAGDRWERSAATRARSRAATLGWGPFRRGGTPTPSSAS